MTNDAPCSNPSFGINFVEITNSFVLCQKLSETKRQTHLIVKKWPETPTNSTAKLHAIAYLII